MHGTIAIPFSELFADTCAMHGWLWSYFYYTGRGMSAWEFEFWQKATNSYEMFGR